MISEMMLCVLRNTGANLPIIIYIARNFLLRITMGRCTVSEF